MKKFLASMMIAVTALSMIAEATARPMGGGRSIGRQSQAVSRQQAAPAAPMQRQAAAPAPAAAPAAVPPKPASAWKGMLGGALLGLGLGAMLSHFGMGGAMASMLSSILMIALLALAAMFIYRMFRRKNAPAAGNQFQSYATPAPAGYTPEIGSGIQQPAAFQPVQQPGSTASNMHLLHPPRRGACRPISTAPPSCATPSRPSSGCRPPGTRPTSTTCANSPRRKCSPS